MSSTDDLQFVREMTEAGRKAPLIGGRFLVFWGSLLTLAYLMQWATLSGRFGLPDVTFAIIWIGFGLIGAIGSTLLGRSLRNKPGRGAITNRVDGTIWRIGVVAILATFVGVFIGVAFFGKPLWLWDLILLPALAAYGVALFTTGSIAEQGWMRVPALIALGALAFVPALVGTPALYILAAAVIIASVLIPGLRLMANEPKALPEEA